ncbi:SMP-30/gluconolactonase/LRE family protein [Streptomyces sp. NPDC094034]|uniref:SMP-30/gluconolactonase/LRE family protein n=1 Tax=Streptomyces sp. NPDC094034 TaxID=3155309 RepID=UPI00332DF199
MVGTKIEAPFGHRSLLGEGPHWGGRYLHYVDIEAGDVHRLDPTTGELRSLRLGRPVGFVVPADTGGLVVARRDTVELIDDEGRLLSVLSVVEADEPETRINDGVCDPRGRLFYGTIASEVLGRAPVGGLYRTGREGTARVFDGISVSNGTGFDESRGRMYYVDSWTWRVDVCDYEVISGVVSRRRPFVQVDRAFGMPDGLTVDAEGGVWVALFGGGAVHRYDPDGELTEVVSLPVTLPTSVAFGGADLRTLFVTTASHRLTPAERAEQPLAGGVLVLAAGVAGMPAVPAAVS